MRKKVVSEISIQHVHPILYNDYSICELVRNSKLSNFSIKVLNDICTSFGLDTSQRYEEEAVCRYSNKPCHGLPMSGKWGMNDNV